MPDYMLLRQRESAALAAAEQTPDVTTPMAFRSALCVDDVSYAYPGTNGAPVLRGRFSHHPGAHIRRHPGIIGGRQIDPGRYHGRSRSAGPGPHRRRWRDDGEDNRTHWRAGVAYLPQDAPLFHDTLRANLLLGARAASDAEIWACLETVHAAELVRSLPLGLETLAGDRGVRLSGGERQRLRLASALLRKPELLILDQSTNALSPADEARIISSLQHLRGAMTIILIAHRTTSVEWTDRVLVVRGGRIAADGPPGEVLRIVQSDMRE